MGFFKQVIEPFIPPFLRVNAETWNQLPSQQQIQQALRWFWRQCTWRRTLVLIGWIATLYYVHFALDGAVIFVILSGFLLVFLNLDDVQYREGDISAYSVFNRGAQRMLGSLGAEQFEVCLTIDAY